jgi:hypothetical protein
MWVIVSPQDLLSCQKLPLSPERADNGPFSTRCSSRQGEATAAAEGFHSALGYPVSVDNLNGKGEEIFNARDVKLVATRAARRLQREGPMPHLERCIPTRSAT